MIPLPFASTTNVSGIIVLIVDATQLCWAGTHLLEAKPDTLDHFQAVDLMKLDARDMRVAARMRRLGYASRYPHQLTIRSHLASGARTELSKIVNGKGGLGVLRPCQRNTDRR